MVALIFLVAVLNLGLGYALAVYLGHARLGIRQSIPKFTLPQSGATDQPTP